MATTPSELLPELTPDDPAPITAHNLEQRQHQMFPTLSAADIRHMHRFGHVMCFKNGDMIFEAGKTSFGLMLVLKGGIRVDRYDGLGNSSYVTTHQVGQFSGEVAQLSGRPMLANGEADGEGLRHAIAIVDTMTAIHSVAAINAALFARTSTGKGQHIDLALYDTALVSLGNMGSYYLIGGDQPKRAGNGHFASAPNSSFNTSNGKIYMAVANQKLFVDTCKAMGRPEWATDPRFSTIAQRVANKPELTRLMEEVLVTDTKGVLLPQLEFTPTSSTT